MNEVSGYQPELWADVVRALSNQPARIGEAAIVSLADARRFGGIARKYVRNSTNPESEVAGIKASLRILTTFGRVNVEKAHRSVDYLVKSLPGVVKKREKELLDCVKLETTADQHACRVPPSVA